MIFSYINTLFQTLTGYTFGNFIANFLTGVGFTIGSRSIILMLFLSTFICFLFRIIYKFKCALFGKKKRKKER